MTNPIIKLKIGDTFRTNATYKDANNTPVNLTTAGITPTSAALHESDSERYDLTVALLDQSTSPGQFTVSGDTSTWKPGRLRWDIRYTDSTGYSFTTETELIELTERIT